MSNNLLAGKRGIIFGALNENSIAWKVAQQAVQQGAKITLTNAPIALRMGEMNKLAAECNAEIIAADVTSMDDLKNLFEKSMEILGGKIDFVLHSVGMSINVRKGIHSVLTLSYIAAQRVFPDYNDMADAKALLESITRSFGYHYGKFRKVRVNSISQSPTYTTAGSGVKGFDGFYNYANKMSPLGNATADQCAEYCISMFSDYTRMVTMQNLFHDGGFSFTGVDAEIIEAMGSK